MRERWIVLSNCQSFGLANSIDCLARDIDCTACDIWEFRRLAAADPAHFRQYDFALVLPEVIEAPEFAGAGMPPYKIIPSFQFAALHPDSVYVFADGEMLHGGVIGSYHSMIALAAYKEGLAPGQAATFFNPFIYRIAGFFGQWLSYRLWVVEAFRDHGLDIASLFTRRDLGQPFMHTVNHPSIEVLFTVARAILTFFDRPMFEGVPPPPDNLAGLAWPIYPEIGESYGIPGAYLFKPEGRHKPIELEAFLAESFGCFAPWHRSQLRVIENLERPLKRIRRQMRGEG